MNYKIYYLTDKSKEIRYIGLTRLNLKKRLSFHLNENRWNTHKTNWIKKNRDYIDIILIEDNILTIEDAKIAEITYIKNLKQNGVNLTNGTDGGDYPSFKRAISKNKGQSKYNEIETQVFKLIDNGMSESKICKKLSISKGGLYRLKLKWREI